MISSHACHKFHGIFLGLLLTSGVFLPAQSARGQAWVVSAPDITGASATWGTLEIVNGNPAIYHTDQGLPEGRYVRAVDAEGDAWGSPVTPSTPVNWQSKGSLRNIGGFPAVSYYDGTNLRFIRASDANGTAWGSPVIVETTPSIGSYSRLLEVNGRPAVAYVNESGPQGYEIKYARAGDAAGTTWGAGATIGVIGISPIFSFAIIGGNPAVAYYDYTQSAYLYRRAADADGTSWNAAVTFAPETDGGGVMSLVEVNGRPACAYNYQAQGELRYVRANDAAGSSWPTPTVVDNSASAGFCPAMAIVGGVPAVAYMTVADDFLSPPYIAMYVAAVDANGAAWGSPSVVADMGGISFQGEQQFQLLAVSGQPAVTWVNNDDFRMRYARFDPVAPPTPSLTPSPSPTPGPSTPTPTPTPFVADPGSWISQLVATPVPVSTSEVIPIFPFGFDIVQGQPAVTYSETSTSIIVGVTFRPRYARSLDALGMAWGTPVNLNPSVDPDDGFVPIMGSVGGAPAVTGWRPSDGQFVYARATAADGSSWAAPNPYMMGNPSIAEWSSVRDVGGRPAVIDASDTDIRYVRASNAQGTAWPAPLTIVSGSIDSGGEFEVVNGNPGTCYRDTATDTIYFIRALDAAGATWGTPVVVDTFYAHGGFLHLLELEVVNGRPAIIWTNVANPNYAGEMMYVRANDPNGTTWGTPVNIPGQKPILGHTSLREIAGRPAIAYRQNDSPYSPAGVAPVFYVRALDANGSAWGTPETVGPTLHTLYLNSPILILRQIGTQPAIFLQDADFGAYLYRRAPANSVDDWGQYE